MAKTKIAFKNENKIGVKGVGVYASDNGGKTYSLVKWIPDNTSGRMAVLVDTLLEIAYADDKATLALHLLED